MVTQEWYAFALQAVEFGRVVVWGGRTAHSPEQLEALVAAEGGIGESEVIVNRDPGDESDQEDSGEASADEPESEEPATADSSDSDDAGTAKLDESDEAVEDELHTIAWGELLKRAADAGLKTSRMSRPEVVQAMRDLTNKGD